MSKKTDEKVEKVSHAIIGYTRSDDMKEGVDTCICGAKLRFKANDPQEPSFTLSITTRYEAETCPLMIGLLVTQWMSAHCAVPEQP